MIRYYAYYNHGGYKDLYLGSNIDTESSRYFLPLLSVYENDESMAAKVKEWKELPSILNLTNETSEYNYPKQARVMMSHAGYKLQYRIIDNKGVFALRDIEGSKDSYGRNCPFVMMMVADGEEEKKLLRTVCSYTWQNLSKMESFLSSLFVNDFDVNGLRFDLGKLHDFFIQIIITGEDVIDENTYNRPVEFFVPAGDIRFVTAFEEQQITKNDVSVAYNVDKTKRYRYTPPQNQYAPTGSVPMNGNSACKKEEAEHHHSLRKAFGFAKAEDLESLTNLVSQLRKRIEMLEQDLQELKNH